jgi:hypothetical protein
VARPHAEGQVRLQSRHRRRAGAGSTSPAGRGFRGARRTQLTGDLQRPPRPRTRSSGSPAGDRSISAPTSPPAGPSSMGGTLHVPAVQRAVCPVGASEEPGVHEPIRRRGTTSARPSTPMRVTGSPQCGHAGTAGSRAAAQAASGAARHAMSEARRTEGRLGLMWIYGARRAALLVLFERHRRVRTRGGAPPPVRTTSAGDPAAMSRHPARSRLRTPGHCPTRHWRLGPRPCVRAMPVRRRAARFLLTRRSRASGASACAARRRGGGRSA